MISFSYSLKAFIAEFGIYDMQGTTSSLILYITTYLQLMRKFDEFSCHGRGGAFIFMFI